jgi:hypothetical protein
VGSPIKRLLSTAKKFPMQEKKDFSSLARSLSDLASESLMHPKRQI